MAANIAWIVLRRDRRFRLVCPGCGALPPHYISASQGLPKPSLENAKPMECAGRDGALARTPTIRRKPKRRHCRRSPYLLASISCG